MAAYQIVGHTEGDETFVLDFDLIDNSANYGGTDFETVVQALFDAWSGLGFSHVSVHHHYVQDVDDDITPTAPEEQP